MTGQHVRRRAESVFGLIGLALVVAAVGNAEEPAADPVRIGMLGSLLKDVPDSLLAAMQQPFSTMMAQQTGLNGELIRCGDAAHLARLLAEDNVQLGIFRGIDFGHVRQKYPQLTPLMICMNKHPELRACLLVRADCPATAFADLRDQVVTLPKSNPHHCQLYFQGLCKANGLDAAQFPGKLLPAEDFEESLDQLVDGAARAAVVDAVSLECYQRRKPGRAARLKVLDRSMAFPCACVAYHAGNGLDNATLKRFKQGMLNANQTYLGKRMFNLFKMTGFEQVPANYDQKLREAVEAFPAATESEP